MFARVVNDRKVLGFNLGTIQMEGNLERVCLMHLDWCAGRAADLTLGMRQLR